MAVAAPKAVGLNSGPRSAPNVLRRSRPQHGSLGGGHEYRQNFRSNGNPKHARGAAFLQATPAHATCQRFSTSRVVAEGRTVDVLPKKRAASTA